MRALLPAIRHRGVASTRGGPWDADHLSSVHSVEPLLGFGLRRTWPQSPLPRGRHRGQFLPGKPVTSRESLHKRFQVAGAQAAELVVVADASALGAAIEDVENHVGGV